MFVVNTFYKDSTETQIAGFVQSAPMSRQAAKRFRNRQRKMGKIAVISRWAYLSF
jgi:hypothetical protein